MIRQRKKQVSVTENREYKETDSINSVQLSLKSHPLWVTCKKNSGIGRRLVH